MTDTQPAGTPAETATHASGLGAGFPAVAGRCPACRGASLFLGQGGHVTCARSDCPDPAAADNLLHGDTPATVNGLLLKLGAPDVQTAYGQAHQLSQRVWELAGDTGPDDPDALRGSLLERAAALLAPGADDVFCREQWTAAYRRVADQFVTPETRGVRSRIAAWAAAIENGALTPWADTPEPSTPPTQLAATAPAAAGPHPGTLDSPGGLARAYELIRERLAGDPDLGNHPAFLDQVAFRAADAVAVLLVDPAHLQAVLLDQVAIDVGGEHGVTILMQEVGRLRAELAEAKAELERWRTIRTFRRWRTLPPVPDVPDALPHAAAMLRAASDEELPEATADLLRTGAQRLKAATDAYGVVAAKLAEATADSLTGAGQTYEAVIARLRAEVAEVTANRDRRAEVATAALHQADLANQQRDAARAELAEEQEVSNQCTAAWNTERNRLEAELAEVTADRDRLTQRLRNGRDARTQLRAELATARRDAAADAYDEAARYLRHVFADSIDPEVGRVLEALAYTTRSGGRPVPGQPQPATSEPAPGQEPTP